MFADRIGFELGGIVVSVHGDKGGCSSGIKPVLVNFLSGSAPDVVILVRPGMPEIVLRERDKVFDSQTHWRLYQVQGRKVLVSGLSDEGVPPDHMVVFGQELKKIEVFRAIQVVDDGWENILIEFPLAQILMVFLLAQGRGLLVHACGIVDAHRGYLFVGNSGHGKSTMARLWDGRAVILNDDRIILRQKDGRFWMFGTPWHGDVNRVSKAGVPLERVFFLRQSTQNMAVPVKGVEASAMLLTRSFPPMWDARAMTFTLDFVARLSDQVPFSILEFAQHESIVDFVRCME